LKLRPEEITQILKSRIEQYDVETDLSEVGTVLQVGDGIARIYGLENAVALEMLELEHGVVGLAFNLEEDDVGAALFGEWQHVSEGEPVRRSGRVASVPVGEALLGRVVDPLGNPLDGQGPIDTDDRRPLEFKAPGVVARQPVKEPLQTGIKAIDSMTNVGRGQRELIIGDRSTGKTAIAIDAILNQHDQNVKCFYVAVGQKASTVVQVYERLREAGAMAYTTIVSAPAHEAAPIKWMAPFAGCAMGEYFLYKGEHALVIYDDLSKHADAYRQLSDGAPDHRDPGGRHRRVHPDERDLDHRRADLPPGRPLLLRCPPGRQRRHLGVARRLVGTDEGDEEGRRPPAPRPRAVPRA
jgi:F-type H+-transporting ATPase subunit alpha